MSSRERCEGCAKLKPIPKDLEEAALRALMARSLNQIGVCSRTDHVIYRSCFSCGEKEAA